MSFEREAKRLEEQIRQRIQAKKLSQRRDVLFVAQTLAKISGLQTSSVLKRIHPRDEDELETILRLYDKIEGRSLKEMLTEPFFSKTFLNWNPTKYQLKFLKDQSHRIAVRWCRQKPQLSLSSQSNSA